MTSTNNKLWREKDGKRILQCHSRGDTRFTPFNCYIEAFGVRDSIENHYQCAKIFDTSQVLIIQRDKAVPGNWREAKQWKDKGLYQIGWEIGMHEFPLKQNTSKIYSFAIDDWGIQWYISLWYKYLKLNPHLIAIASDFDDFEDIFKGKPPKQFPFCQADVIRKVVNEGLDSLIPMCSELWEALK